MVSLWICRKLISVYSLELPIYLCQMDGCEEEKESFWKIFLLVCPSSDIIDVIFETKKKMMMKRRTAHSSRI